jgi:hypothetical protein
MAISLSIVITLVLMTYASAIPESDINKFRASGRETMKFDAYTNNSRTVEVRSFQQSSSTFYLVFRANPGDVAPYDDFYVRFECDGDVIPAEFHTTDYPSWVATGIVSIGRTYRYNGTIMYINATWGMLDAQWSSCRIISATGLVVIGNAGYATFNVETVPVLGTVVITLDLLCADEKRANLTAQVVDGIFSVFNVNLDILNIAFIILQTLAVIFVVIGVPATIFLLIRWVVWRMSGYKIGGG